MSCQPEDLLGLRPVGAPTLAAHGREAVASVQSIDADKRYGHQLWSFASSRPGRPLSEAGPWSDTSPSFSSQGDHVAFISNRGGRRSAYVLTLANGQTRLLADFKADVITLLWVGEDRLAAVVERYAESDDTDLQTTAEAPVQVSWLRYKTDGRSGFKEPATELWLLSLRSAPKLLHRPQGRVTCVTVTECFLIYAVEKRHSDELEQWTEVRSIHLDTGLDRLLWHCPSTIQALAATDRSGHLIAVSTGASGHSPTPPRIWQLDAVGSAQLAFGGLDISCEYAVYGDSRSSLAPRLIAPISGTDEVAFIATVGTDAALFVGQLADAHPRRVSPLDRSVTDFSSSPNGRIAVCMEDPCSPTELYLLSCSRPPSATRAPERISNLNVVWASGAKLTRPQEMSVTTTDGLTLSGLLYLGAGPGTPPLVVRIHGGPHLCYGSGFDLEAQVELSAGYSVLLPNQRGSAGQGSHFRSLSVGEWGGKDYEDIMAFVDYGTDNGLADPDQLYLTGGSYGGFLTNFALTRTGRFRAAVSERSISNFLSKYGTADNGFSINRSEMGGADIFDDGVLLLLERSPLFHARSVTTPVLLLHGEADQRCPIEQSEQFFVALRRLGKEAVFVRFPTEAHFFPLTGRPENRIARMTLTMSWMYEHSSPAHRRRGCIRGLKPPVSSSDRVM